MKRREFSEVLEEREELFNEMIAIEAFNFVDKRRSSEGNFRHSLQEVLLVWLCGMICGFKTYRDIELYAELKIEFFRRFFPYKSGHPSKSTLSRVIGIIDPAAMNELLQSTIANIRDATEPLIEATKTQPIALDGKTSCGFQLSEQNKDRLHMVSAYDTADGVTLTQEIVPEKSNEIIAMKSLLASLAIEKRIITTDAMGTQKDITQIIRRGKGHYILTLKENHKTMYHAVKSHFDDAENLKKLKPCVLYDKGHGRIEKRTCYATDKITIWFEGEGWVDLQSIIMVKAERTINGTTTSCTRYFISDLAPNPEKLLKSIRSHWAIESMHWTLDVTFNEDGRIHWNKTVAHNESIARRIVMNMLTCFRKTFRAKVKSEKTSYALLQKIMFADDDALELLLRKTFK